MTRLFTPFRIHPIAVFVVTACTLVQQSLADVKQAQSSSNQEGSVIFDASFLSAGSAQKTNLERYERGMTAIPGKYVVDVSVNNTPVTRGAIEYREQGKSVMLYLSPQVIKGLNLDYSLLPDAARKALASEEMVSLPLATIIPGATQSFDSGEQRLELSVPQALLKNVPRGYVDPAMWDDGVPAAMLGYTSNFYTTHTAGRDDSSGYVGLNTGINVGSWYFRHNGNYNWQHNGEKGYQRINTYVQHDIAPLGGRVILGENNTSGQVFDSLPYRGVSLEDDERMLPQSERGYAPVIHGIANTNARVTVRQNGQVIYDTTVAPGAFNISDLYPSGYGGNLDVTVTEADGRVSSFSVPYAAAAQLLRPSAHHYSFLVSRLNDNQLSKDPELYQLTYQRGLNNTFTGYGGLQGNGDYQAIQIGSGINTPIGAVALDATQAHARLGTGVTNASSGEDGTLNGQSYRLSYSKFISETDSNLSVAAYRFSTSGYLDFRTAMQARDALAHGQDSTTLYRPKNRLTVTASQGLPDGWGQLYISGYAQNYWNQRTNSDLQYQAGYSNNIGRLSYSMNAGRSRTATGDMDTTVLINLSVPLGRLDSGNSPQLNASMTRNSSGSTGETAGISGSAGQDNQFSYGLSGSHYNRGQGSSGSLNGQYRSPVSSISGSVGTGKGYRSGSLGLSGTLIGYQGGVVMTPYTGDTFAIVEADGASGAKVGNYSGLRIDRWGHAAVPYLNPYEMNEVDIDPTGINDHTELQSTSQKIAPHSGAVVRLKYDTVSGLPLLITTHLSDGSVVPFGASVTDSSGMVIGSVGQGGMVYARVPSAAGSLQVRWGEGAGQHCTLNYQIHDTAARINRASQQCHI